jgi:hypothetical protein
MPSGQTATPGFRYGDAAEPRRTVFKVTIDREAWTAAAPLQAHPVYSIPARTRVVGVILDTTTAFGGPPGALAVRVGKSPGGQEYLLDHDVKSAPVTRGLVDGDLGPALSRAGAVQGGDLPSWRNATSLYVTLRSTAGHLGTGTATNLTSGQTVLYVIVEALP